MSNEASKSPLFTLTIDVRTPAFGTRRRDELARLEQVLMTVARQVYDAGGPIGPDGGRPIQDGNGNVIGRYYFGRNSLVNAPPGPTHSRAV